MKRNVPPSVPSNLPAKLDAKSSTPASEMNPAMYETIRDYLKAGEDRSRVNSMIIGHPKLLEEYLKYGNEYDRIKQAEYGQPEWEELKKIAEDMEDTLKMVQSI